MLKGKTGQLTTFAAALLTTTFMVAATEAQARRYDGTATRATGTHQVSNTKAVKAKKAKKAKYTSKKVTRSKVAKNARQRASFTVRQRAATASRVQQAPAADANTFISQIDPESPYAIYTALQNNGVAAPASAPADSRKARGTVRPSPETSSWSWGGGDIMRQAESMIGMSTRGNRGDLKRIFASTLKKAVDPARTPWCAAWANAVLAKSGVQGTGSLLARSFLNWGTRTNTPSNGDVVIIARGRSGVSGHVGFFVERQTVNGRRFVKVLGGNQGRQVKVAWFPESKVIGYRKAS